MTPEQTLVATAVGSWTINIERADKVFSGLSEEKMHQELAPGKNRLIYLLGHLTAVHDGMLPLLGFGPRQHSELDAIFISAPDRAVADLPTGETLKRYWKDVNHRLQTGFDGYTAADWLQKHAVVSAEDFAKNPLRNRLAILLSRAAHVSYHLGQANLAQNPTN